MRDIVTAQEMYYRANGAYFTSHFSDTGTHTIPNYLDARRDSKHYDDNGRPYDNKDYPNYVWLKNNGDVSGCITGEYFCVYATLKEKPIKYYAASERGMKEVDFIPGSIGGIYGIDHCNCFDTRKQTEISDEKTTDLEKSEEERNKQEDITKNIIIEKQELTEMEKVEQVVLEFYQCYIGNIGGNAPSMISRIEICGHFEEKFKQSFFEIDEKCRLFGECPLADHMLWASDTPGKDNVQVVDVKIENENAEAIVTFIPIWTEHKVKVFLLLEDNEWKISNIEKYK